MQKSDNETPLTLSQQAYLIGDSLKEINKEVFYSYAIVIGFILFLIGMTSPSINPAEDLATVKDLLIFLSIISPLPMIWYYIQSHRFSRKMNRWNEDYLHSSYTLILDTTVPKGNNTAEKILSLAKLIFPELRSDYLSFSPYPLDNVKYFFEKKSGNSEQERISKSLNYSVNSYSFDLALKIVGGYFIVKYFKEKIVTTDDLKDLVKIISSKFKNKYGRTDVFRCICVAKNYDQSFFDRESLELQMTQQLKTKFPIDLVVEENIGYSVLWVGR